MTFHFLLIYRQKAELKVLATYLSSAAIGEGRDKNPPIWQFRHRPNPHFQKKEKKDNCKQVSNFIH